MRRSTTQKKHENRLEKIDQITRAGRILFLKKGYQGASMRQIAKSAGMTTGAVYFYFKGKDEIYLRICEEAYQIITNLLRQAVKNKATAIEKIAALAIAYEKFYTDYPEYLSLMKLGPFRKQLSPEIQKKLDLLNTDSISIMRDIIEEGIQNREIHNRMNSLDLTLACWSAIEGIIYLKSDGYLEAFDVPTDRMIKNQVAMFKTWAETKTH